MQRGCFPLVTAGLVRPGERALPPNRLRHHRLLPRTKNRLPPHQLEHRGGGGGGGGDAIVEGTGTVLMLPEFPLPLP